MIRQRRQATPDGFVFIANPPRAWCMPLKYDFAAVDPATRTGWTLTIETGDAPQLVVEQNSYSPPLRRTGEWQIWRGCRRGPDDPGDVVYHAAVDLRDPVVALHDGGDKIPLEGMILLDQLLAWARRRAPFRGGRR